MPTTITPLRLLPLLLTPLLLLYNFRTLLSLSHSLTARVATLRAARGDHAAAKRATLLSQNLENCLGFNFKSLFSFSYDFLKNYVFTRATLSFSTTELPELISTLTELTRINSPKQRAVWVSKNYMKIVGVLKRLLGRMGEVVSKEGPLKEVVEALRKEVVEGELLKDVLEIGGNDLVGIVQILKDIATQHVPSTSSNTTDL